nr:hypothetical protein [Sphingomonas sp. Y57]
MAGDEHSDLKAELMIRQFKRYRNWNVHRGLASTSYAVASTTIRYVLQMRGRNGETVEISSVTPITEEELGEAVKFGLYLPDPDMPDIGDSPAPVLPPLCPRSFWIDALVSPDIAQDMQANLAEVFDIWVERHGERRARWILRGQVFRCISGDLVNRALGMVERIGAVVRQIGGA